MTTTSKEQKHNRFSQAFICFIFAAGLITGQFIEVKLRGDHATADELVFTGNATKPAHPSKKALKVPACFVVNGEVKCAEGK